MRKVLFPLVFHAGAGEVANFVTTRERKAVCVRLDYQRIRQIERNSCCRLDSSNTVAKTCHVQLSIFYIRDLRCIAPGALSQISLPWKNPNLFEFFIEKRIPKSLIFCVIQYNRVDKIILISENLCPPCILCAIVVKH